MFTKNLFKPFISAADTFFREVPHKTTKGPHIRDAIDIKRWMVLVVIALIPCILTAIWNTGLQRFVYSSGDYLLMNEYLAARSTLSGYFDFACKYYYPIISGGLGIFLPLTLVVYGVGIFWEAFFAGVRGHEISEGFFVSGILIVLILPPTIPLWMVAVGVSAGIVFAKEIFGGSGMNIVNPALAVRAFLFFGFPGKMTGNVWVGADAAEVRESLVKMNQSNPVDGYTQATKLAEFNIPFEIKKIHVDAIATNQVGENVSSIESIKEYFRTWNTEGATLGNLNPEQLRNFVTSENGLNLSPGFYEDAYNFSELNYGLGQNGDWGFFLGDKLGCIGETSTLACILGAIFLIYTGIASWRTILGMTIGAFLTATFFEYGAKLGDWNPAIFGMPAYKHFLLGGMAFGIVFMATDPVSSPTVNLAKWIYGIFCGVVTIIIRLINPAYPEGVMLAILMGNVFAPLFDYYAALFTRRKAHAV